MDIVLTIDDIHILVDVIIVDLICVDLISRVVFQKIVMTITNQVKGVSYCDQCLEDDFMPSVVKIFGCLHQQNDDFYH
jgi:hypothetical protein